MSEPRFGRLLTAMVTPFDLDLKVDLRRTQELADRIVAQGSEGLVICGTTGESPTISHDDKMNIFRAVIDAVGDRVPVIANIGSNDTAASVESALEARELGAAGLMAVVPYYNKPPQEGIYRHFKAIADAVDLPVVLYNIPGRCVVNAEAETILRLAHDHKNIVAVKQANDDLVATARIAKEAPSGFEIFAGDDTLTLPFLNIGGVGVISTIGNVASKPMRTMIDRFIGGDYEGALAMHQQLLPLMTGLFRTANPILVKTALELAGFPVGGVRLPLVEATPDQRDQLRLDMQRAGVIN